MDNNKTQKRMGRPPKAGVKRAFYLEKELADLFDEFCYKTGRSKTRVAEIALAEYIERHKDEMEK